MRLRRLFELWPLAALCLLLGTRWMFADAWPSSGSTLSSQAAAALLGAAVCGAIALRQRTHTQSAREVWRAVPAGVLLFGGLNVGLLFAGVMPKATDLMVSMSLTPIVMAVAMVAFTGSGGGLNGADLLPGLCAGAGLLIIVPVPSLDSYAGDAVLVLAPVAVGVGAILLAGQVERPLYSRTAAAALGGAAAMLSAFALGPLRVAPALSAIALDLLTLLLTLLSLKQCGLRRFSAQFAAVPLLLLLEGLVFVRIRPNWEQAGGLGLLMIAVALLLREPANSDVEKSAHLFS